MARQFIRNRLVMERVWLVSSSGTASLCNVCGALVYLEPCQYGTFVARPLVKIRLIMERVWRFSLSGTASLWNGCGVSVCWKRLCYETCGACQIVGNCFVMERVVRQFIWKRVGMGRLRRVSSSGTVLLWNECGSSVRRELLRYAMCVVR